MNKYEVTLKGQYAKNITVYAKPSAYALEKIETILFDTGDSIYRWGVDAGDATINDQNKSEYQPKELYVCEKFCRECVFDCPLCGGCLCEAE